MSIDSISQMVNASMEEHTRNKGSFSPLNESETYKKDMKQKEDLKNKMLAELRSELFSSAKYGRPNKLERKDLLKNLIALDNEFKNIYEIICETMLECLLQIDGNNINYVKFRNENTLRVVLNIIKLQINQILTKYQNLKENPFLMEEYFKNINEIPTILKHLEESIITIAMNEDYIELLNQKLGRVTDDSEKEILKNELDSSTKRMNELSKNLDSLLNSNIKTQESIFYEKLKGALNYRALANVLINLGLIEKSKEDNEIFVTVSLDVLKQENVVEMINYIFDNFHKAFGTYEKEITLKKIKYCNDYTENQVITLIEMFKNDVNNVEKEGHFNDVDAIIYSCMVNLEHIFKLMKHSINEYKDFSSYINKFKEILLKYKYINELKLIAYFEYSFKGDLYTKDDWIELLNLIDVDEVRINRRNELNSNHSKKSNAAKVKDYSKNNKKENDSKTSNKEQNAQVIKDEEGNQVTITVGNGENKDISNENKDISNENKDISNENKDISNENKDNSNEVDTNIEENEDDDMEKDRIITELKDLLQIVLDNDKEHISKMRELKDEIGDIDLEKATKIYLKEESTKHDTYVSKLNEIIKNKE